jgi:hypothetical protein
LAGSLVDVRWLISIITAIIPQITQPDPGDAQVSVGTLPEVEIKIRTFIFLCNIRDVVLDKPVIHVERLSKNSAKWFELTQKLTIHVQNRNLQTRVKL